MPVLRFLLALSLPHTLNCLHISNGSAQVDGPYYVDKSMAPVEIIDHLTIFGDGDLADLPDDSNEFGRHINTNEEWPGQTIQLEVIKGPSDVSQTSSNVVVYITTHLSDQHKSFLQCWPSKVLAGTKMLAHADIIVQTFGDVGDDVKDMLAAFPNKVVRLGNIGENPGYQTGALKGVTEAFRNGWMANYEWMIRVNPDVVIWNEAPLVAAIQSSDKWGVFANCRESYDPKNLRLQSDFFAIRVKQVSKYGMAQIPLKGNAENHITVALQFMLDGTHEVLLVPQNDKTDCRMMGGGVWHDVKDCAALFKSPPWLKAPPER